MHPADQSAVAQQILESRVARAEQARAVRGLPRSRRARSRSLRLARPRPALARLLRPE